MRMEDSQPRRNNQRSSSQQHRYSDRNSASRAPRSNNYHSRGNRQYGAQHSRSASAARNQKQIGRKRVLVSLMALAVLVLLIVLILNLPLIPYTTIDHAGNEMTTNISMMQKFRNWQPFIEIDGELNPRNIRWSRKKKLMA